MSIRPHVMPTNDLVEHVSAEDCVCGPRVEFHAHPDLGDIWVHVHHSLDARESREQA